MGARGSLPGGTPAQQRLAADLLAWGGDRPAAQPELVSGLRAELDQALRRRLTELEQLAASRRDERLVITRTLLERTVCDGWQLEPEPFGHTWENVRSHLAVAAIVRDWERQRSDAPEAVVARVWDEEASRRPGDPTSRSAWLNACRQRDLLSEEVAGLVRVVREVWPPLPPQRLTVQLRGTREVPLVDGKLVLRGTPDVVLDSPVRDDRARALVVDLRTGLPRPAEDRLAVRFDALLVALETGRAPFRWASLHVTDGRVEYEDLAAAPLRAVVDGIVETVDQLLRLQPLAPGVPDHELRLAGGSWCRYCRRRRHCPLAVG
ncbi:MAG: PD-(D/E)XK nuclease family protein [Nitriliruptoraceae bacterium]